MTRAPKLDDQARREHDRLNDECAAALLAQLARDTGAPGGADGPTGDDQAAQAAEQQQERKSRP